MRKTSRQSLESFKQRNTLLETGERGTKSDFELLLLQALTSSAFVSASRIPLPDGTSSPVTGLEWPRGFQEVKVPIFHDNGTGWW